MYFIENKNKISSEKIQNAINEWQQMREKRQNLEISDEEYLEWKLNLEIENLLK